MIDTPILRLPWPIEVVTSFFFCGPMFGCKTPEAPGTALLAGEMCRGSKAKDCAYAENADHVVLITRHGEV